jgi:hypothetical protein
VAGKTKILPGIFAAATALVVLGVNTPVLGFDWLLFDDDINVFFNPYLGGWNHESLGWAVSNLDYVRRYLPLGWLGFDALIAIDGYNAVTFHAAGWFLSGLNAALACLLAGKLFSFRRNQTFPVSPTRRWSTAMIVALFWSLHPARAETAGWISGLLYLASTCLAIGAVWVHTSSESSREHASGFSGREGLGALLYFASLLTYPVYLALPVVLLVLTVARHSWPAAKSQTLRLAGWWLAAAITFGVNVYAQAAAHGPFPGFTPLASRSLVARISAAGETYLYYLAHTLWPENLAAFVGHTGELLKSGHYFVLGLALPILLGALAWRKTRRAVALYVLVSVVSLVPFLGAMNADFHPSDRYLVLWLGIFASALGELLLFTQKRILTLVTYAAAVTALCASALAYREALQPWKNFSTLQARIDAVTAEHPDPIMNYARPAAAFWWLGERSESARRLAEGLTRFPFSPRLRETEKELAELDTRWRERVGRRTSISPLAVMHYDLGSSWLRRGHRAAAAAHFKAAFVLAPTFTEAAQALVSSTPTVPTRAQDTPRR